MTRLVITAICLTAAAAQAQLVTFEFTDLDGTYNFGTSEVTADAVNAAPLFSGGDVSLLGGGDADYDAGFLGLGTSADFGFSMTLSNIGAATADATGMFDIIDADGDTITGTFDGIWEDLGNGFSAFDGTITLANFADNGAADNQFDGPSGGAFSLAGLTGADWTGGISFLMPNVAGFFADSFASNVTLTDGIIDVPAPASLALLGLGGIAIRRRR